MNARVVLAVARTTFAEFWRAPEAVFWTYGFPVLLAVVLGFSFQPKEPDPVPVAVVAAQGDELDEVLRACPRLRVEVLDAAAADTALARGAVAAVVSGSGERVELRADPARPDAEIARLLVDLALRDHRTGAVAGAAFTPETRPGSRYIDFLIPGLVCLNLLGAGLWGIGFNLVQWRTQNLLRRLLVTPMRRSEFMLGFLASRLVLVVPEAAAIVLLGVLGWGVPFRGSIAGAVLVLFAASLAFSGLGILVASRARTIEGVSGLMNLCLLPMWLLGGVFFGNDRLGGLLRVAADAMPLTWCTDALRDLMLAPTGIADVLVPTALLLGFAAITFALALRLFRWT